MSKDNHIYRIILRGSFVDDQQMAAAIAATGLSVESYEVGYSLHKELNDIPLVVDGLADFITELLEEDCDYPSDWQGYSSDDELVKDVLKVCNTDTVMDLAEQIRQVLFTFMDLYNAEQMTIDLIRSAHQWM